MIAVSPAVKPEAARARAITTLRLTRPLALPPMDRRHEFLSEWLPERSVIVRAWISQFIRSSVPYRVRLVHGQAMLYTHKLSAPANAHSEARWCCRPQNGA
jgi:hypothetical protein